MNCVVSEKYDNTEAHKETAWVLLLYDS